MCCMDILFSPKCVCIFSISDVKGPKKIFPDLPFGNPDIDKVEVRKGQLDTFLKVGIELFI